MRCTAWARRVRASGAGPASTSTVGPPGAWNSVAAPSPTSRNVSVGWRGGVAGKGASRSTAAARPAVAATSAARRRRARTKAARPPPARRASQATTASSPQNATRRSNLRLTPRHSYTANGSLPNSRETSMRNPMKSPATTFNGADSQLPTNPRTRESMPTNMIGPSTNPPATLAGGFVLGPIMFVGMLSLVLGFVGSWLSAPLNVVAGLFIGFLMEVSRLFGRLPFAVYEWRGVSLRLLLLVAFCGELAVVAWLARRAGGGLAAFVRDRRRRAALVAATAGLAAAVLLLAPLPATPPRQPTLTFLDVGEGAATLFQAPGGPTVLVDAGPAPLARTLRAHAVQRIDLLVLSHGHADHTAGLSDVVGSIPITTALLPRPPTPSAALEAIAARLTAAGAKVRWCEAVSYTHLRAHETD